MRRETSDRAVSNDGSLSAAFRAARVAIVPADERLEARLRSVVKAARARYPSIDVSDVAFVTYLASRVEPNVEASLRKLKTGDLLLACGCAHGDRTAIGLLESNCIREARTALSRRGIASEIIEDAEQNVRERLFVGNGAPRILEYDGRGDLTSWVRVVVVREAILLSKRGARDVPLSCDLLAAPDLADDPETAYFKSRYRAEYKDAFEAAVGELSSRERALLRQQIFLGMSSDEIGRVYSVHRATAARWVQAARDELLAKVRLQLAMRLNVSRAELESIARMIETQLTVSMSRLLRSTKR